MVFFVIFVILLALNLISSVLMGNGDGLLSTILSAVLNILYLIAVYMVVSAWKAGRPHNEILGIIVIIIMILSIIGLFFLALSAIALLTLSIAAGAIGGIVFCVIIFLYLIIAILFIITYFQLRSIRNEMVEKYPQVYNNKQKPATKV